MHLPNGKLFFPCSEKRFPFDSNNPIGYLIAVILEYIIFGYTYIIAACTVALGIGLCLIANAVIKEIQDFLHSINRKARRNQSNELKAMFLELMNAHTAIKQLSFCLAWSLATGHMGCNCWSTFMCICIYFIRNRCFQIDK